MFRYLFPFYYFYRTRLLPGSISFHLLFEWVPATVVVVLIGRSDTGTDLIQAVLSYLAFISLYEIGYLVNDLFSSRKEIDGRRRGPETVTNLWLSAWFATRLIAFFVVTAVLDRLGSLEWWSSFGALAIVFGLHNLLRDREMRSATFQWLAWLRFMAPIFFVVADSQLLGVALSAAMTYGGFRMFGYLDAKGMLAMPGRKRSSFRLFFFVMSLAGVVVLWSIDAARGYVILSIYFALAAAVGTALLALADARRSVRSPEPTGKSGRS